MNDKKLYEEISKLNELVLHKGLVPSFEEIINQLEKQKEVLDKIKKYINKHCVNQDVSKEVGYKCFTMADTQELEYIYKLLEEIK